MKTAIQELFSKLETEHPNLFNTNTQEGRKFINDYYTFFELEKKQIIDAYYRGSIDDFDGNYQQQYYNKTFKLETK
jgi:hypothetical protein